MHKPTQYLLWKLNAKMYFLERVAPCVIKFFSTLSKEVSLQKEIENKEYNSFFSIRVNTEFYLPTLHV